MANRLVLVGFLFWGTRELIYTPAVWAPDEPLLGIEIIRLHAVIKAANQQLNQSIRELNQQRIEASE
jgi:hypothetical protein